MYICVVCVLLGKSGQVAQRFSSSLTSVGISSQFVHAAEWAHGDLGKSVPIVIQNELVYQYHTVRG